MPLRLRYQRRRSGSCLRLLLAMEHPGRPFLVVAAVAPVNVDFSFHRLSRHSLDLLHGKPPACGRQTAAEKKPRCRPRTVLSLWLPSPLCVRTRTACTASLSQYTAPPARAHCRFDPARPDAARYRIGIFQTGRPERQRSFTRTKNASRLFTTQALLTRLVRMVAESRHPGPLFPYPCF